jgi:biotin carboxyl carrier protein
MCIVEVMKLMNHVKAGVGGTVVAVFGRDGTQVDKDEPLFAVARDDGAG